MRALIFSLLCAQIVLTSCIYSRETYYKPIGPGGYYKTACAGPDNALGFKIHDALGLKIHTGTRSIGLTFYLREGHRLQLEKPEIVVIIDHGQSVMKKTLAPFTYSLIHRFESEEQASKYSHEPVATNEENKEYLVRDIPKVGIVINATYNFPSSEEFKGRRGYPMGFADKAFGQQEWETYGYYMTQFDIHDLQASRFVLGFPFMFLDGSVVQVPEITIEQVTEYVRHALLC